MVRIANVRGLVLVIAAGLALSSPAAAAKRALFDNAHAETAGNADWIIDNDQPIPSPAQSSIGPGTPGTYWLGAISTYGVELVKQGYTVATNTVALTYQNVSNPYDLSNYDVLVIDEPNILFTASEAAAILNFVQGGGGLIAISDHSGSDRNNDGADSPVIWNALDPSHLLGVHFGVAGDPNNNITQTSLNVNATLSDSVTHGVAGVVDSLAFHAGTTMTLYPGVNPSVRGEVWMTGLSQSSTTGLMAASATYGNGRVFFLGDSSPVDDGSAQPGNSSIFDGWNEAKDGELIMSATLWASRRAVVADSVPPSITVSAPNGGENWKAGSTHSITWNASDNVGVTTIDLAYSLDGGATYPYAIATGTGNTGSYSWLLPASTSTSVRVRATAHDAAGNAASDASDANFTISTWTITASAGAGGTINPSGAVPVVQGSSAAFTISPSSSYHIAGVLVDGGSVGAVSSYTFSNVAADHTISAQFSIDQYPLDITIVGRGAVQRNPDQPLYDYQSTVTVTATAAVGYAFAGWTGDMTSASNPLDVTINGPVSLTARFTPVIALLAPDGGESIDIGSTFDIQWTVSDSVAAATIDVLLSRDGPARSFDTLAVGRPNSGHFAWTVSGPPTDSAYVKVVVHDADGLTGTDMSSAAFRIHGVLSVNDPRVTAFALEPAWPNPTAGHALLRFATPVGARVRLTIADVQGREMARLVDGWVDAGHHAVRWAASSRGAIPPGMYLARLATPAGVFVRSFALIH